MPEPGWLSRQFKQIKRDRKTWPKWMRGENGMPDEQTAPDDSVRMAKLLKALAPFVRTARGIPHNWPGQCVLTFDETEHGTRHLSYLKEDERTWGLTIADWRVLLAAVEPPRPSELPDSVPEEIGDEAYRSEVIKRAREALKPLATVTPERLQATIEALCAVAATTFMVQHSVPYSLRLNAEAMSAAYNGMIAWLDAHEQRN